VTIGVVTFSLISKRNALLREKEERAAVQVA